MKEKVQIFKLQLPIATSEDTEQVMMYNKSRKVMWTRPVNAQIKSYFAPHDIDPGNVHCRHKIFMECSVTIGIGGTTIINPLKRVRSEKW